MAISHIETWSQGEMGGGTATAISGKWGHFVVTWNSGTILGYLNGVQAGSAYNQGGTAPSDKSGALNIGRTGGSRYGQVSTAGVAVYNSTLTAAQVKNHYWVGQARWRDGGSNAAMVMG